MQAEKLIEKKLASGDVNQAYLLISGDEMILNNQVAAFQTSLKIKDFDVITIAPEDKRNGEITIEKIRRIKSELGQKSASGKRMVVIKNSEKINQQAANSFLKTLEEPPPDTLIILLSQSDNIIPTIRSRCQKYLFPSEPKLLGYLTPEMIEKWQKSNIKELFAEAEKITKEEKAEACVKDLLIYYYQKFKEQKVNAGLINHLQDAKAKIAANVSPRLVLENLFLAINHKL